MVVCVVLGVRPSSSWGRRRRVCCGCCCSPLAWGRNEERNQSRIKFWSVEEIVGEFGKRARACGTVAEHAVQCSAVPCSQSSLGTDRHTSIDQSIASINPSIDVSHSLQLLLTHSVSQSVGPPLLLPAAPPPQKKHWERFIYFWYRGFGWQNLTQKVARLVQFTPEKQNFLNFFVEKWLNLFRQTKKKHRVLLSPVPFLLLLFFFVIVGNVNCSLGY